MKKMPPNNDGKIKVTTAGSPLIRETTLERSSSSLFNHNMMTDENKTEFNLNNTYHDTSPNASHHSEMEMNRNKTKEDIDGSAPNESDDPNISPSTSANLIEYRVYPERWWLLSAVLLLNISNYAHWVAFPVVVKTASKYYNQSGDKMDLIPTLSYGLGVPCCLLATYVVERHGLKNGLQIGGFLTGIGGLLCFLSSLPPLSYDLTTDTRFQLALIGQALTGVACPFIACVPTKISQHWFADEQRTLATALLGLSGSTGCIFGLFLTPQFVHKPSDITIMNSVWFVPAAIGSLLTMWKVRANYPLLPPSPSASEKPKSRSLRQWLGSIKDLFMNKAFIIIFLFLGACMGCLSSVQTKMEQMLCARGYSDQLSGLAAALIFACAAISSIPIGLLTYKLGSHRTSLICKSFIAVGLTGVAGSAYFMRFPDQTVGIIISSIVTGSFAAGAYPIALELVVECTYPIDQATSTAFIFLSSALQGVLLMGLENFLHTDLSEEELEVQTCVAKEFVGDESKGHQEPKDYSSYLTALAVYCWAFFLLFVFGFHSEMKRSKADELSTITNESLKQQNHEIKLLLEPSSKEGGIIKQSAINNTADKQTGQNEYYFIKKDEDNNVQIYQSNGPDNL